MARPLKLEEERYSENIKLRVTPLEREKIIKKAEEPNMSESSYLRQLAIKGRVMPIDKLKPQLLAELGRVGNLNQIAHKANANGQGIRLDAREYKIIEEMREILRQVSESFVR